MHIFNKNNRFCQKKKEEVPSQDIATHIKTLFLDERNRWILWLPVGFGTGIAFYFGLLFEPPWWLGSAFVAGLLPLLWIRRTRFILIPLLVITAGFACAQLRTHTLSTFLLSYPSRMQGMTGTIQKVEETEKGTRLTLTTVTLEKTRFRKPLNKVRVTLRGKKLAALTFRPGQQVRVEGSLMPPNAPIAPGAYDFRRKAYFDGLSAVGFSTKPPQIISEASPSGFWSRLTDLRHRLTAHLRHSLGGMEGAIAAALVTGDRAGISDGVRQEFADSGLAHILAISGLHLSIVAGLIFFALRKSFSLIPPISLRYPIKKWAAGLSILCIFAYLLICDFAIPAQRAFIMTTLILTAVMLDRTAFTLRNVALAATGILIWLPESLPSPSFQMSFAAVVALVAGYERLRAPMAAWQSRKGGQLRQLFFYFLGIVLSTILATIATTPYILYTFNRFTMHAIPANMICIPLLSFAIMPLLVIYLFLSLFGCEGWVAPLLTTAIEGMTRVAHTVANWPGSVILVPSMTPLALGLCTYGLLWMALWRTPWRAWGTAGIAGALVVIALTPKPDIFVAAERDLVGVLGDDGKAYATTLRAGKFARESWQKMVAMKEVEALPFDMPAGGITYDDGIYWIRKRDTTAALLKHSPQNAPDWTRADLWILLNENVDLGDSGIVITNDTLRETGGVLVWLDHGVRTKTVRETIGDRPWSLWWRGSSRI